MTLISFLLLLVIAGICGAIGQAIAGFQGGLLVSIAVGFIGALIGVWLADVFGVREIFAVNIGGRTFPIIWSHRVGFVRGVDRVVKAPPIQPICLRR